MNRLTAKEEEVMQFFWQKGELFVKQIQEQYEDPKPHINTLSTIVRTLEVKGFVGYKIYGNTYQYYPLISETEYRNKRLKGFINKYFGNSYKRVISELVEEEVLSVDELKEIIREIEGNENQKTQQP